MFSFFRRKTLQGSRWKNDLWSRLIQTLWRKFISNRAIDISCVKNEGESVFWPFFTIFWAFWWRHKKTLHGYVSYHLFYTEGDMGYPNIYTFHVLQYMQRCLVTPQSGEVPPKTRDNLLQNRWDKAQKPPVFLNLPPFPPKTMLVELRHCV